MKSTAVLTSAPPPAIRSMPQTPAWSSAPTAAAPDEATPDEVILGDVDGDREVMITDATYLLRKIAQIEIPFEIHDAAADADEDGLVTIMDATCIQRWLANLTSNDHIGKPALPYGNALLLDQRVLSTVALPREE